MTLQAMLHWLQMSLEIKKLIKEAMITIDFTISRLEKLKEMVGHNSIALREIDKIIKTLRNKK